MGSQELELATPIDFKPMLLLRGVDRGVLLGHSDRIESLNGRLVGVGVGVVLVLVVYYFLNGEAKRLKSVSQADSRDNKKTTGD